jgi:hypothetical protein
MRSPGVKHGLLTVFAIVMEPPIAQPEKGARYCKGAASEAVAATMTEYFISSFSPSLAQ